MIDETNIATQLIAASKRVANKLTESLEKFKSAKNAEESRALN